MHSEHRLAGRPGSRRMPRRRHDRALDGHAFPDPGTATGYESVDPDFDAVAIDDLLRQFPAAGAGGRPSW